MKKPYLIGTVGPSPYTESSTVARDGDRLRSAPERERAVGRVRDGHAGGLGADDGARRGLAGAALTLPRLEDPGATTVALELGAIAGGAKKLTRPPELQLQAVFAASEQSPGP